MIKRFRIILLSFLLLTSYFFFGLPVLAEGGILETATVNNQQVFSLGDKENSVGYTASAFNDAFKVSLPPNSLATSTSVDLNLETVQENLPTPWNLNKLSAIYKFSFSDDGVYGGAKPLDIQISYDQTDNNYKRIFFYDSNNNVWRELPSVDYPQEKFVRAQTSLVYATVAVFSDPGIMTSGKASWYSYKGGDFAASPDFPKGSKLRVTNLDNGKTVDVTINDFGPDRIKHPDRVVDLDKKAFLKIASIKDGIINIKVLPLFVPPDSQGRVLGIVPAVGAVSQPEAKAKEAIVVNEKTGKIIWEKNSTSTWPLASLSKLMAIKVFFDQKIPLNKIVTYKKQDELYNYQYCSPAESASLKVKDGETMTVQDLVYSALIASANNAVESLVRVSGLSRNDFIKEMNETAASFGATSTKFIEPTGLSPENVSTARDYAIITKEVFKNTVIEKISSAPKYTFKTKNTKKTHTLYSTNDFIRDGLFAAYNNLKITGSKTGYLNEAQENLMTRATGAQGEKVIAVVLGAASKSQVLEEVEELLIYGIRQVDNSNVK